MRKAKKSKPRKPSTQARPRPELNEAGRALLGRDDEKRRYRPRQDDASVEDPLQDWPES